MLDLGNLRIGITVDSKDAKQELGSVGEAVESAGGKWVKFGKIAAGATAAAVAAVGAFAVSATKDFLETSDHIDKMSQKLGISAEAYQEWDYVMGHAGMDIDSFNKAMRTMRNNLNEGSDAFNELGIATQNADGSLRSEEEIMKDAILTLADMEDTTERNRLAQEL